MNGSIKAKQDSPLCPWIFSGVPPSRSKIEVQAVQHSSRLSTANSHSPPTPAGNDLMTWKDEPQCTTPAIPAIPSQNTDSIECVCGSYPNFTSLAESLRKNNISFRADSKEFKNFCKVTPQEIKRISLICCRVKSFQGLANFPRLSKLFISDGIIPELLWEEFELTQCLQELSIVYSEIKDIEELKFTRLTKLNLWANKLTNLKFLGCGLPCLKSLNVAENRIITLHEKNLFKCFNLECINLSGNPICSLSDIKALKVCPALTHLYLNDALHGDCPVASLCSYRVMVFVLLDNLMFLDGIEIREDDREFVSQYSNARSHNDLALLDPLENSDSNERNKILWKNTHEDLKAIEAPLRELQIVLVHSNRVIRIMKIVPDMSHYVTCMKKDIVKIEVRISTLRSLCQRVFKDTAKKQKVGKWEDGVQAWLNRLDFDTFGSCRGELLYSSLKCSTITKEGEKEMKKLGNNLYDFIYNNSCEYSFPKKCKLAVESVFITTLHATETGMQRIYNQCYGESLEPEFVKLQNYSPLYCTDYRKRSPLDLRPKSPNTYRIITQGFYDGNYNREAAKLIQVQKSFRVASWEPKYEYEFPESIPGLPDPGLFTYMFLICPEHKRETLLEFLNYIMTGNSECYKNVLLTFCAWKATNRKSTASETFSVLIIVKVLKDFLIPVEGDKISEALFHDRMCQAYCLEEGATFAPAFVVLLSFFPLEKSLFFGETDNNELIEQTKKKLHRYSKKLGSAMKGRRIRLAKGTMFLNKIEDNVVIADLTSLISYQKKPPADLEEEGEEKEKNCPKDDSCLVGSSNIAHFLGEHSLSKITKLKLSCNFLKEINGLQGLKHLRSLDISHNQFKSLNFLPLLPQVTEFKVQHNNLQSFENCLEILAHSLTRLSTVELLPNPFKDITDWSCLPILVQKKFVKITRVDGWLLPFNNGFCFPKIKAPKVGDYACNKGSLQNLTKW